MKLLQIRLLVDDFKKTAAFYKDILGLSVSFYEEETEYALFNNGETKIELLSRKAMAEVACGEGESQAKFLLQFEVEDVDKAYNRFKDNGIEFVTEPHDRKEWRARIAHFRDPEKNLIEIYHML
ncbi:VOC family protein [Bacillus glycinifermentans]|uniref:VOC family protein n=1 Tax=Bacillus glycinifermentans TaxID=1664069 RepID=A0A0T6BQ04_9BACI|nr:VOC family protein [Bacillus glycinifermentans]ATH94569.1 VOC family protein [Bacillus glycinifermentans]KRT93693.1 hypothetical protein AB447_218040 [Bacillus glycinifermentans]MEC0486153.1 VOC family protein [Bacillus glycinifermentans]